MLPLLFLDELALLRGAHPLVDLDPCDHGRRRWPAAIRFRHDDYLPRGSPTAQCAVARAVADAGGHVRGPVAMLGHVRTWGWLFNPLTLFYCFDPSGSDVEWTVLEVSNTPWHERHTYVVGPPGTHTVRKELHVSPFLPAQGTYSLRYSAPADTIGVRLEVDAPPAAPEGDHAGPPLSASMTLRRTPLDRAGLGRLLWTHPLMTTRVSGAIYAQALRLAARGAPVHRHPARRDAARAPAREVTVRNGYRGKG